MPISIRACARRREASAGRPRNPSTSPAPESLGQRAGPKTRRQLRGERGGFDAADKCPPPFFLGQQVRRGSACATAFVMDSDCIGIGGRCEIRTHERLAPLPVFKTGALNRSANLPFAA